MSAPTTHVMPARYHALSPQAASTLLAAGNVLAAQVRSTTLRGPRPVFLYYTELAFTALSATVSTGIMPRPQTPAQQLCLALMIDYAEAVQARRGTADFTPPIDFTRLRAVGIADDSHARLAAIGRNSAKPGSWFDFIALGHALSARGMDAFFAPLERADSLR
ncbi:hypothetical protein ACWFRF_02610 [Nocardia sp. NPDC055165]